MNIFTALVYCGLALICSHLLGRYLPKNRILRYVCSYFLRVSTGFAIIAVILSQIVMPTVAEDLPQPEQGAASYAGTLDGTVTSSRPMPTPAQAWAYIRGQAAALMEYKTDLEATGLTDPRASANFINHEEALMATNSILNPPQTQPPQQP